MSQILPDRESPEPLVSVIVPAWNAASHLGQALESVSAQNHAPQQVIVIDDGSSDATAAVAAVMRGCRSSGRKTLDHRPRGIGAWKRRVHPSSPSWAPAITGQRSRCHAYWMHCDSARGVDIAQGLIQRFRERRHADGTTTEEDIFQPPPFINLGSGLFRREVFERVGPFDDSLPENEDTDWKLRAWERGVAKLVLAEVVLRYRSTSRA